MGQLVKNSGVTPPKPAIVINQNETNPDAGAFIAMPRFWVDEYFKSNSHFPNVHNSDGSNRAASRVPSSFWKYTLALWRWLSIPRMIGGKWVYTTTMPLDSFPVRQENAVLWTAAYSTSGVVDVKKGKWTVRHDQPTVFTYNPSTAHLEWRCFFNGLDLAWNRFQIKRSAARRANNGLRLGTNVEPWAAMVAHHVDVCRKENGLLPLWERYLAEQVKNGHATIDDKGMLHPVLAVARRRPRAGESDDDYETRLHWEIENQHDAQAAGGFYPGR